MTYANRTLFRTSPACRLPRIQPRCAGTCYSNVLAFPPDGDCAGMRAEIDAIAERIGVEARETVRGHYVAARSFGPIEYRAVAICQHYQERT